jgi:hypothetical protein
MRFRVAAAVLVAVLGLALAWIAAAPADNPVLHGTVGPGFDISLTDASGNDVKHLDPGTYTVQIDDKADIHNYHLFGPGVEQSTTPEFVGQVTWTVTFADGTYTFQCDPHSTLMHGTFTVGTAATTATTKTPPPPPPVHKLSGRVGPGAHISFPRSAPAGKARITVRDVSTSDNFHLAGPGVNKRTSVRAKQTLTWNVTLRHGTYTFRSDAHATLHGKTRVSEVCVGSAAVDDREAAEPRLFRAFAAAPEEQAHRRADASGEDETCSERAGGDDGQLLAQFPADAHPAAQVFDRGGETLALGRDLVTHVLRGAAVLRHRSSALRSSASPRRSPASARAACRAGFA